MSFHLLLWTKSNQPDANIWCSLESNQLIWFLYRIFVFKLKRSLLFLFLNDYFQAIFRTGVLYSSSPMRNPYSSLLLAMKNRGPSSPQRTATILYWLPIGTPILHSHKIFSFHSQRRIRVPGPLFFIGKTVRDPYNYRGSLGDP